MSEFPELLNKMAATNVLADSCHHIAFAASHFGFVGRPGPSIQYQYNKQVHGTTIVEAKPNRVNASTDADGLWTKEAGLTIAVRTADCLPVLFRDKDNTMVMAVHAGWRGLTSGILANAISIFAAQGINPLLLTVAIGPAIGRAQYEVGPEVVTSLFEGAINLSNFAAALCITKGKGDRWYLDLQTAALISLIQNGVAPKHIDVVQTCTWSNDSFFSYRREGKGVGSNISWIRL